MLTRTTIFVIILVSALCLLTLASSSLTIYHQSIIAWGLLGILSILKRIEPVKNAPWRIIYILLATFISARYWLWRTFETLIYTGPVDFIGMMLLYLAETYAMLVHFIGLFVNLWPLERKLLPLPDDISLLPTVDVFIPTYNEPEDIVRITVTAAKQIDYPKEKIQVYILDDGGTTDRRNNPKTSLEAIARHELLKKMATDLGVHYITRDKNEHAKAGNINNAMDHTHGELLLLLDCDHVPTRDILKNTVAWFLKDKKLFLVQTPHFFINPDPIENRLETFSHGPSENEMFYKGVHHGLDMWNSSYFCGSAAVLRRSHLEEVGGIAGDTITEDAETALSLHRRGYNSVYVDRPMVCGLSPDTFDDFIVQRSRWAQGMVQIFILKKPLFTRGLKFYQRLSYFNSSLFWFFGFSRLIFYIAPVAFLLFGLKVYHASVLQVVVYAVPHFVASIVLMDFQFGKFRWPLFSELYESVQSIFLIPSIISAMINPRAPTFKVTPKGEGVKSDHLSKLSVPFYLMFLVLVVALPVAVFKWFQYPLYRDVIFITFTWCLANFFLALASLGAFRAKKQARRYHRIWASGKVQVEFSNNNSPVEGDIEDLSMTGIGIEMSVPFEVQPEEEIWIKVSDSYGDDYRLKAKILRQIKLENRSFYGCDFASDQETYLQLVKYVYGDSQRWVDFSRKKCQRAGPFRTFFFLIRMGFKALKESFVDLNRLTFMTIWKSICSFFITVGRFVMSGMVKVFT